jgi:NTP pyrophosphatase (non-canonical NTP hydrolase)
MPSYTGDDVFSNELSLAQAERLAFAAEEMGEALQAIGKILRHGYESYNPVVDTGMTNRRELEQELGDVYAAIQMLGEANDVSEHAVGQRMIEKKRTVKQWMHHQDE